jgi:Leucine-rich repeat (LRR) protein
MRARALCCFVPANSLTGSIPSEFGLSTSLTSLDFSENSLTSTIPSELFRLSTLVGLLLLENSLSGPIPDTLSSMSSLQSLELNYNYLSARLSIYNSSQNPRLVTVDLQDNLITGKFSLSVDRSSQLSTFSVGNGFLTGPIDIVSSSGFSLNVFANNNYLSGTMGVGIALIAGLSELDFEYNWISGSLPTQLGITRNISSITFGNNMLVGSIPPALSNCPNLFSVSLPFNSITGSLPPDLFTDGLSALEVNNNQLRGTVPDTVTEADELLILQLNNNQLSGPLPSQLGGFELSAVSLQDNMLTGTISSQLLALVDYSTTILMYSNLLSGRWPDLERPTSDTYAMFQIYAGGNYFSGDLPSRLINFESGQLYLQSNYLSGTVSTGFAENYCEYEMVLNSNFLSGSLPPVPIYASLASLVVGSNLLNGTVPAEYERFVEISEFDLSSNAFSGTIPVALTNSSAVTVLVLANNSFVGPLNDNFGPKLKYLDVSNNSLTGSFPYHLGPALATLSIQKNLLSGPLSVECGAAGYLSTLIIDDNEFTGDLAALGCLSNISVLSISNNSFVGSIDALQYLPKLEQVVINGNSLSGTLPAFLAGLSSLRALIVADNKFYGQPDVIFNSSVQTLLTAVDISSNDFSGSFPVDVFALPNLESFASIKTCFSGSLPSAICSCTNLKVLLMDGVTSGPSCQRKFRADAVAGSDAYVSTKGSLAGGIPSCVWSGLPLLTSLHLSSNGLTGTIGPIPDSSNLSSIVLSYNQLSGTIPVELLSLPFTTLELSNNRFKGTVDGDLVFSDAVVYLQNNRLSGYLPISFSNASQVSIVEGNLINCDKEHPKPAADAHASETACGSSPLNDALVVWAVVAVALMMATGVLLLYSRQAPVLERTTLPRIVAANVQLTMKTLQLLAKKFDASSPERYLKWTVLSMRDIIRLDSASPGLPMYLTTLEYVFTFQVIQVGVISLMLCIPLYLYLKFADGNEYSSHTYQYQWLVSATFLTGVPPAVFVLLLWTISWLVFVHVMRFQHAVGCCVLASAYQNSIHAKSVDLSSQSNDDSPSDRSSRLGYWRYIGCVSFLLVHFIVMACVNAAYLYIILSGNFSVTVMSVSQVAVSIVKVLWDSYVIPFGVGLLQCLLGEFESANSETTVRTPVLAYVILKLCCSLLTAMVIPFIVSLFVNSLCFLDLFIPQSVVNENFYYNIANKVECLTVSAPPINISTVNGIEPLQPPAVTDCLSFGSVQAFSTDFYPPFSYSFQCGSGILTSYVPVLIYSFTFRMISLLAKRLWRVLKERVPFTRSATTGSPGFDCSHETQKRIASSIRHATHEGQFIATSLMYCVVLLTFGLASPALAGIMMVSMIVELCWHQWELREAFQGSEQTDDAGTQSVVATYLEQSVRRLWNLPSLCMWPCVHLASVFWALMVFDMIGDTDAQHPRRAWWGPFLVCVVPCLLRLGIFVYPSIRLVLSREFGKAPATDGVVDNVDMDMSKDAKHAGAGAGTVRSMTESVDSCDPSRLQRMESLPLRPLSSASSRSFDVHNVLHRSTTDEHNSQFV